MTAHALSALGAGFSNEALGSQAVFRAVLQALSQPGQPVRVDHDAQVPSVGHSASATALLAMLDSDCTLWLSPRLAASNAGLWLRFHTGCQLVDLPEQARFVWGGLGRRHAAPAHPGAGQRCLPGSVSHLCARCGRHGRECGCAR